jgi:uncharacterized protein YbbC (DUF1343 family)
MNPRHGPAGVTRRAFLGLLGAGSGLGRALSAPPSAAAGSPPARPRAPRPRGRVRPGLEVFVERLPDAVRGRSVGLITNQTGVDRALRRSIDLLAGTPDLRLAALFGPEHGIHGDAQAGVSASSGVDAKTGLPVHSLYGGTRSPTPEMLRGLDALVFDIQDVGARFYTYQSTLALAMRAAASRGIPFVVLDRPNPLGGEMVDDPCSIRRGPPSSGCTPCRSCTA